MGPNDVIIFISLTISKIENNIATYCCSIANCTTCSSNGNQCDVCNTGYYKQGANCNSCSPCIACSGSGVCTACPDGQYLSGTTCSLCLSPCSKCVSANNQCTACVAGYLLIGTTCTICTKPCTDCTTTLTTCTSCVQPTTQSIPSCDCTSPAKYLDSGTSTCLDCNSPCLNCSSATSCDSCVATYMLSGTTCLQCTQPCKSCSGTVTNCTSCIDTLQTGTSCACPTGYYTDSTSKQCGSCTYPCATCQNSGTYCMSCESTYTYDSTNHLCKCLTNEFELSGSPNKCQSCTSPCLTCSTSSTHCDSCVTGINRHISGNQCVCDSGYTDVSGTCQLSSPATCSATQYLDSSNVCQSCTSPCYGCNTASTTCTSCINNYYLAGSSCLQCTSPCFNCIDNATKCQSCVNSLTLSINQCLCSDGFYMDLTFNCQSCTYPCTKCVDNANKCLDCASTYTLNVNTCQCPIGYYQNLSNTPINCQQCTLPCLTCEFNSNHCLTCQDPNQILDSSNQCQCQDGYYSIGLTCDPCQSPCSKCQITATQCTACINSNLSVINNTCGCLNGYSLVGLTCIQCISNCIQCIDSINCQQCNNGYYLMSGQCVQCNQNCLTCQNQEDNCLSCKNHYELIDQTCICQSGYYESLNQCLQCQYPCTKCTDLTICLECNLINHFIITDSNQCKCLDGYYESQGSCLICDSQCLTCSFNSTNCLNCDQQLNRILKGNKCECSLNYFENSDNECISCQSQEGKIIDSCKYSDCSDQVWTYGEQCDDGNDIIRDGCSYCKIDSNYSCQNQILQKSICFKCNENCNKCQLNSNNQVECTQCQDGYFIYQSQCSKCSDNCLNCQDNASNCLTCRFIKTTGVCQLCEQMEGYYSDFTTNKCYTKCGDSIKSQKEECDDGNLVNGDGCDKFCHLESKFICKDGLCITPQYPLPKLSEIGTPNLYDSQRSFILEYDIKLKLPKDINISSQFTFYIVKGENISLIYYPYKVTENQVQDENNFTIYSAIINIILNKTSTDEILELEFKNKFMIESFQGYQQQVTSVSAPIKQYILIDEQQIKTVSTVTSSNSYFLYALCVMAGGAILFGGVDIFYNLLDTLQMLSYLKYVNTQMPYNLQSFFDFFGFAQLTFISKFVNLQSLINEYIDEQNLKKIPQKIANDQYNSLFIINGTGILIVWLTSIGAFIIAKFMSKFIDLNKPRYYADYHEVDEWVIKLRLYYLSFKIYIAKLCQAIVSELIFSGMIRIQITTAYDYLFSVFLQIFALQINSNDFLVRFSSYLAIFAFVLYILVVYFVVNYSNFGRFVEQKKELKQNIGSIFEGVNQNMYGRYFNAFLLIKKSAFMFILIFCYSYPIHQAANLTLIFCISNIYLIFIRPLKEKPEFYKQVSCEINTFLTLILLSALAIDDEKGYFSEQSRSNIGWGAIVFISAIILIQLAIDAFQQWVLLLRNYAVLKKIYQRFSKFFKQSQREPAPHNLFVLAK